MLKVQFSHRPKSFFCNWGWMPVVVCQNFILLRSKCNLVIVPIFLQLRLDAGLFGSHLASAIATLHTNLTFLLLIWCTIHKWSKNLSPYVQLVYRQCIHVYKLISQIWCLPIDTYHDTFSTTELCQAMLFPFKVETWVILADCQINSFGLVRSR